MAKGLCYQVSLEFLALEAISGCVGEFRWKNWLQNFQSEFSQNRPFEVPGKNISISSCSIKLKLLHDVEVITTYKMSGGDF